MYTETTFPVIDLAGTGRSIELHRRQAGLTVRDLQTYFGFEYPQAIYKWQHGECLPTVDNLLALARLLRVSMEDLLVYKDQEIHCFWGFLHGKKGGRLRFGLQNSAAVLWFLCGLPAALIDKNRQKA